MPKAAKVAPTKGAGKKVAAKRKGGKYQMPDPLPSGEILIDLSKKQWKLGPSIGKGGFGEIYSATEVSTGKNSYVIKIEPKENGPLFVEMHFFIKVCKSDDIENWMCSKKLKFLGLPRFQGSGSYVHNGKPYRFVVMERFGKNLDEVIKEKKSTLSADFIYKIALHIIDTLEYIHHKGYVHADIKGGNLLLGLEKGTEDKVYLVDFGLASKYSSDFKPDPKCAHNGTIEFTSRDAHVGATTRRGDMEILAFNMLRWFTSRLPWENKLSDCTYVQQQKLKYMSNVPELMEKCFGSQPVSEALKKYFEYVSDMAPTAQPDYDFCRRLFQNGLKTAGVSSGRKIQATSPKRTVKPTSQSMKKVKSDSKLSVPQEQQKVDRNGRSPRNLSSSEKQSLEKIADSKPPRPVRAVRKINKVYNGYIPESDSFSDDSDVVCSPPKGVSGQRKGVKRHSNDKDFSPKKKHL